MNTTHRFGNTPFQIIASKGLGLSTTLPSDAFESRPYGKSKLHFAANIITGNLIAQDKVIRVADIGGPIELSYLCNSLDSTWRLNAGRKIKLEESASLLSSLWSSPTITMLDPDGNEVKYSWKVDGYYPEDYQDGMPCIKVDETTKAYRWYHPKLQITECFDANGNLQKRIDVAGNETRFEYNADELLQTIISSSHTRYEIRRHEEAVRIVMVDTDHKETLLHSYQFENGNIKTSVTADGYVTEYSYHADRKLREVKQSDCSKLQFNYGADNKLKAIQVGDEVVTHQFTYESDSSVFTDAIGNKIDIGFDVNSRPVRILQDTDALEYKYHPSGQLQASLYPDGSREEFDYEAKTGLLAKYTRRDRSALTYHYGVDEKSNNPVLLAEVEISPEAKPLATTRYVYDGSLLRYAISPEGRVKEFTYTSNGLLESKHDYTGREDHMTAPDIFSFEQMNKWKNETGRLSRRTAFYYHYDNKGQKIRETQLLTNDEKLSPEKKYAYDPLGHIVGISEKRASDEKKADYLRSTYQYDDNGLLKESRHGADSELCQKTIHEYKANVMKTTHPNGRVELTELNSQGLIKNTIDKVATVEKKETYERNGNGNITTIISAEGNKTHSYYDKQNRLHATVSAEGAVTKYDYCPTFRYHKKTEYNVLLEKEIKGAEELDHLFVDVAHDRVFLYLLWLNDEIRFTIDAENFLIEYKYDDLGNQTQIIKYGNKISEAELVLLETGKEVKRTPSRETDQISTTFYDRG